MATRQSVDDCLLQCDEALDIAQQQYDEASKQEHYNDDQYTESQQLLQLAANELQQMAHSCNDQQREQLNRMKIQIEQMQHDMITLRH
ncbi:MAG: YtzC family protein [Bacillus sp. (in: firmicutes)]